MSLAARTQQRTLTNQLNRESRGAPPPTAKTMTLCQTSKVPELEPNKQDQYLSSSLTTAPEPLWLHNIEYAVQMRAT